MARFPRNRNWRPLIETLEDRTLLSTSTLPDGFDISQARALSKKHVEIQFSQPAGVDIDLPEDFAILAGRRGQTLRVKGVDVSADRTSAVLTTGNQHSRNYEVRLAASASSARFAGSTSSAGVLVNAAALDNTTVVLRFSSKVANVNDIAAYTLDKGLLVQSAVKTTDGKSVVLTTSPQERVLYTVVAGVSDAQGNAIGPNTRTFVGIPAEQDSQLPRVSSAAAIANTKVIVSFDRPMEDSTLNPLNYVVVQSNVNSEAGRLNVLSALFTGEDRTAVELTTASQNELTYQLTVVNVRDLGGNPIGPPTATGGVILDPAKATFRGMPPSGNELTDTDQDGLTDNEEQRGWTVVFTTVTGERVTRQVTSNHLQVDTDLDGLSDATEAQLRFDPRDQDTDDDTLTDWTEYNEVFSDALNQDGDGDTIDDATEWYFFNTSPVHKDTDGDQIPDNAEIVSGIFNARVADLPRPEISVGEVNLQLDVRFVESNNRERRDLGTESFRSTLASASTRTSTVQNSGNTQGHFNFTGGLQEGDKSAFIETGVTSGTTWGVSKEAADEARREYEKSFQTESEVSQGFSVERSVAGASMQVALTLSNLSNLAYRVKNLQVTALIQDPLDHSRLTPIATLVPDAEPADGFTLGPLVPEHGPVILSNTTIIPRLVEELMANSTGLIFRISNYDIVDERDRNFAFASQDVVERTGAVLIDFGGAGKLLAEVNGEASDETDAPRQAEIHRVATYSGRTIDTNGDDSITSLDRRIAVDGSGKPVGITFHSALNFVGLTRYDESVTPTSSLTEDEKLNSYSTIRVGGLDRIYRIRDIANDDINDRYWEILTEQGIERDVNLDQLILNAGSVISLNFVQDLDQDGLPADVEYFLRTSDSPADDNNDGVADGRDTDKDGLDDRFESLIGWTVTTPQRTYQVYSSPNRADSNFDSPKAGVNTDGDGVEDRLEYDGSDRAAAPAGWIDTNANGLRDPGEVFQNPTNDYVLDPIRKDTDRDGIDDATEIVGFRITRIIDGSMFVRSTNPLSPFTDGDTFSDGFERLVGLDPTDSADTDEDGDGLPDPVERAGWAVGKEHIVTDLTRGGVPDLIQVNIEWALFRADPNFPTGTPVIVSKTGGGLKAGQVYYVQQHFLGYYSFHTSEVDALTGAYPVDLTAQITASVNPFSIVRGVVGVSSVPYQQGAVTQVSATSRTDAVDSDADGLTDYDEFFLKTDPSSKDTDGDGVDDRTESLGYELGHKVGDLNLGIIKTDPLDADTDNDKRSDGAEAELVDVELNRWVVRVSSQTPYRVYSNPLVADADFDGVVDADEFNFPGGYRTDPNNGNTDSDRRDDGQEFNAGMNPLIEDFQVTVFFNSIRVGFIGDYGTTETGDFVWELGVRKPDLIGTGMAGLSSTFTPVMTEGIRLDGPFQPHYQDGLPQEVLPYYSGDTTGNRIHFGPNQGVTFALLNMPIANRAISFGMTADQSFAIEGVIAELDAGGYIYSYLGGVDGDKATDASGGTAYRPIYRGADLLAMTSPFRDASIAWGGVASVGAYDGGWINGTMSYTIFVN